MTKKILAVLLAICMITGTCVLFASAAEPDAGKFTFDSVDTNKRYDKNGKEVTGTKNKTVVPNVKSNPSLNSGDAKITTSNVDSILTFDIDGKKGQKFSELSPYIEVGGTVTKSGNTASVTVTFNSLDANDLYQIIPDGDPAYSSNYYPKLTTDGKYDCYLKKSGDKRYEVPSSKPVSNIELTINLCAVTVGVRFYGDNTENLVNDEIARVNAEITRSQGRIQQKTTGVVNKISDLIPGDTVILSTELKDPVNDKEFYGFNCWVDGNGKVLGTDPDNMVISVSGNTAVYACYVELQPRHVISYTSNKNGKLVVISNANKDGKVKGREVFQGDAQISVLHGKDFEFEIVPDEGYEIAHVFVTRKDGQKTDYDIASFKYLVWGPNTNVAARLAELIKATGADRSIRREDGESAKGTYTFQKVSGDCAIEVVFQPVEAFEVPSGLPELPPAELGMELEGGPEGPEGAEPGTPAAAAATTLPAENGVAGAGGSAVGGVVNPATGSESAVAVFAVMTAAACAAFVAMKKKKD